MKKTLVVMLALFLAIPAISYAGSATSRWDLTIGGNIKFDMGWSDQSGSESGNDMWSGGIPDRNPQSGNTQTFDKYGAQLWGAGETGLNFFVKGPDAWGAKTHALIVGDFTGFWGANPDIGPPANYNEFDLLIAEIGFDWENTSLAMGANGAFFGQPATWTDSVGWNTLNFGGKGAAPVAPQVTVVERFSKEWSAGFGVISPYNTVNQLMSPNTAASSAGPPFFNGPTQNIFRSPIPAFEGKVAYTSDSCGKIGPWQLLVEMDGFYGQIRELYGPDQTAKDNTEYIADFKLIVPIIPEHNGNKAGALLGDGAVFMSQGGGTVGNWDANAAGGWLTSYWPDRADPGDFVSPTLWGIYLHGQYYFTDSVRFNAFYYYASSNPSQALITEFGHACGGQSPTEGAVTRAQQYVANIVYDVNPAVRFTLEWDYTVAHYAPAQAGWKNMGSNNDWRLAAYYFF